MAISTTNAIDGPYSTNGATTVFPFTFTAPSVDEVSVVLVDEDAAETTVDPGTYTVTLDASGGGSVTFDTAPATDYDLYVLLDPAFTQEIEFENGSAWLASPVNEANDRAAARDQWLKARIDRSLVFPIWEDVTAPAFTFDELNELVAASYVAGLAQVSSNIGFLQGGTGAVARTAQDKMRDVVSVLDFGADPTGAEDSTAAFQAAHDAHPGEEIRIPGGTYEIGADAMELKFAGTRWVGDSKYTTILRAASGATGALCRNTENATASSAYVAVEKVRFDLGGEDCAAVDLSSVNNSAVRDCYFEGGKGFGAAATTNGSPVVTLTGDDGETTTRVRVGQPVFGPNIPAGATVISIADSTHFTMSANATATSASTQVYTVAGEGVRCAAPLDSASYTNSIQDCGALYLERAFIAEDAANENTFLNCEAIACNIGFDVENGVDTARLFAGRAEGCNTGLRNGGRETVTIGVRFENNFAADVSFLAGAERASFFACYTATSTTTFLDEANCTGLFSRGGTFPQRDNEPNVSNPILSAARQTFAAAGSTPDNSAAATGYSAFFQDYPLLGNQVALESENYNGGTPDNRVVIASVDASDNVNITAFRRKSSTYGNVNLSENLSARPTGLFYAGTKIVGAQGAAVADATDAASVIARLNDLLARLRAHGLIAT